MKDDELVESFEAGTLAPAEFGHRQHLRLTWIYLARFGQAGAERRMLTGLRALAERAGRADKFDAPLTTAWVAAIAAVAAAAGATTFEELVAAAPALLDRAAVRLAR